MSEVAWIALTVCFVIGSIVFGIGLFAAGPTQPSNFQALVAGFADWRKAKFEANDKTALLRAREQLHRERLDKVLALHQSCPAGCATCQALKS